VSFEDESDFLAVKREVSCTRNPRKWYLLMNTHIAFENDSVPAAQQPVIVPSATSSVKQVPQQMVNFLINYLIVDYHNTTKGCSGIFNTHSA